jgi:tetratricopeptide (TPR) repeat protein
MAEDAGLLELLCEVHQCQAMIFYLQTDYESSDRVFRVILDASEQIGGWYFRGNALWGIGKNLMIQGHHQAAMSWLEEALALYESAGARLLMAIVWGEMAVCHLGLGEDRKSLELLENALRVQSKAGTVQNYLVVLANIGNVYLYRGDYLTAIAYYRRALELAREIKDPVSIQKWSGNLRLAYARLRQSVDRLDSETA